ncbi:hypothetical protein DPM19_00445 [Actinomadura craniellae]|uniref:Uncharacterized protein n=1 Tax=Actinomadura craniellae TaxID=2231787 RepID=A0A365HC69_9ACTN|nr:DNRLRE domain-containing protein [Actinomadura craniellae]RAY16691.1 hypothetical protein DPM19_00445 [Actinomadura craniellae]
MNYQAPNGAWQPIDPRLVTTGQGNWRNTADSVRLEFGGTATGRDLALIDFGNGRRFGFGIEGAGTTPGTVEGDVITYANVRPGADLVLQSLNGGSVKEKIVLRSPDAPAEWEFSLRTEGVTPRLAADGSVELVDATGKVIAHIPHGFMIDSKVDPRSGDPARSEQVTYALEQRAGIWILKVSADRQWLADPARVYPVTIDPTAVWNYNDTSDTYVQTGYGSSPYTEHELKAGTYNGGGSRAATYLGFSQVDNELSHAKIYDVDLQLFNFWSYSCTARAVSVHPVTQSWSQSGIANYPGPSYGAALSSRSFASGWIPEGSGSSPCPARWQGIDLGDNGNALVQGWVNGTKPNYGLTVRASGSDSYGWKKFGSRETPNGPYLTITYSPYNATYAFADNPPQVNPPILNNQAGNIKVKVTNKGHDTWTPSNGYKLTYGVFDKSGNQVWHTAAATAMPSNVAYNQTATVNAQVNPLPPGTWTIKFDMVYDPPGSGLWATFSEWGVPRTAQVQVTVPDIPSQLNEMSPRNNFQVSTLRPQLFAEAQSGDTWPSANVSYQFTVCAPPWVSWEWCENSPWQQNPKWTPPDRLAWGKEYYWTVSVNDGGGTTTNGPWYKFVTNPQQPTITSHLAGPASAGQEFDHQTGNYTTTVTDAHVATAGPPLSVVRSYNSLDPRTGGAFGAGWSTRFDMRAVPDDDGTGNVVVTYPDGQEVRFGRNNDGTFSPPLGRTATFAAVSGGGWRLMDKASVSYVFDASGRLEKVTDHRGREQVLTYGTGGKLQTVTATGGRSLTFTWTGDHVTSVSTDPVNGSPLTWTYTYTGDRLTKVCPPGSTTECTLYEYEGGSHYRTAVLDDNPTGYWRLNEPSGATINNVVPTVLGGGNATATSTTYGHTGALTGTGDTALGFNGTTSRVRLPDRLISREDGHLSVELWFKTTGKGTLFSHQNATMGTASSRYTPAVYIGNDGKLRAQFWNGSANPITSAAAVNNGQWHHVVLSGQGGSQTLYLDGDVVGTRTGAIDHLNTPYAYLGYGWASPSWPQTVAAHGAFMYTGQIDDVAVYDRTLDLGAVRAHYATRLEAQQLDKVTLPSGRIQAINTYDVANDRLATHVDRNGGTWTLGTPTYTGTADEPVRNITLTDPRSGTLDYTYDPLRGNRLVTEKDQLDHTTTYAYDTGGNISKITDRNGNVTDLWYDERGNKRYQQRCRDADTCHREYWEYYVNAADPFDPRNDQLTQYTDGRTLNPYSTPYAFWWQYDTHGQQISAFMPPTDDHPYRGLNYTYTDGTEPAVGGGTTPAGLLKTRTNNSGTTVLTNAYNSAGDLARTTDAAGKVVEFGYDALGRVTGRTEITTAHPAGVTTTFGYDGQGRLIRQTGPPVLNEITNATHTAELRRTYDADGNPLTQTLADTTGGNPDRVTTHTYDAHGRIHTTTDPEGGTETYGHDTTGARTSLTDAAGAQYTFAYSVRGELQTRTLEDWTGNPNNPSPAADVVLDSYAYDPGGRLASHTDAMGRTRAYAYYGDDLLATVTAQNARVNGSTTPQNVPLESRTYDGGGRLTSLVAGGQQRTDYVYDETGTLIAEIIDPEGVARRTDYRLNPDNQIIKITRTGADTEDDDVTDFTYDDLGRMTGQTVDNGDENLTTTLTLDQRGLVTQVVEPRGNAPGATPANYATTMRYDAAGQLVQVTAPPVQVVRGEGTPATAQPVTRMGYNAGGEQTHVTDPEGRTVTTGYDKAGRPISTTSPAYTPPNGTALTPQVTTEYDAAGRIIEATNARGHTTKHFYDVLGNLVRTEDPKLADESQPGKWRFEYDLLGEQLAATDPTGARVEATYDDLGRQITQTVLERYPTPAAYTTHTAYDPAGNPTSTTRPAGDSITNVYNGAGDLTEVTNALGKTSTFGYDFAGRMVKATDPLGHSTVAGFDRAGRQTTARDLDENGAVLRTVGFGYDPAGNRTSVTSAEGHTKQYAYDAGNRLTQLVEPVSAGTSITTAFGYDAGGQRTRLTDGRGNTTVTTYNTLGLVEAVIEPVTSAYPTLEARSWTTSYDGAGNPVFEDKPGEVTVTRTFDELGRLTREAGVGGTGTTPDRRFGYDLAGRRLRVSAPDADILTTYNDRSLPLSTISPGGQTAQFAYDANGRPTSRTDAAGTTGFSWNGADLLDAVTDPATGYATTRAYDDAGRLTDLIYGAGGAQRHYDYDPLDRPTTDELTTPGGATLAKITYAYDDDDRLTQKTTTGTAGAGTNGYEYDHAGRLTKWTAPGGAITDYGWDAAGNLVQAGSTTYTYSARNRLTSDGTKTYEYSARGTLRTDGPVAIGYDAFDRLVSEGNIRYAYDGLNRVAKRTDTSTGTTTRSIYSTDGNDLSAILNPDGTVQSAFARDPGGGLLSVQSGSQSHLAYSDRHDDLTATFNPAGTTLTGSKSYDPFGKVTANGGAGTPLGYQGEYTDGTTGRVNMHARWYTPGTGSFASRDDWTLEPDPSARANRYTYTGGDPLSRIDPSGHDWLDFLNHTLQLAIKPSPMGWVVWGAEAMWWIIKPKPVAAHPCEMPGGPPCPVVRGDEEPKGGHHQIYYETDSIYRKGGPVCDWRCVAVGGAGAAAAAAAAAARAAMQAALARAAALAPAPRPPTKPGISQKDLNKIRDIAERAVQVAGGINKVVDIINGIDNAPDARPDESPVDGGGGGNRDRGCTPVNDYGPAVPYEIYKAAPNGRMAKDGVYKKGLAHPQGIYVRFCSAQQLGGGSAANPSLLPLGFPLPDEATGKSRNPIYSKKRGGGYKWARCHLRGDSLGGSGDLLQNLVTCYQTPVNSPTMSKYEEDVARAVKRNQIVDYWSRPVSPATGGPPLYIRITARGRYRNGAPGINFDVCILNSRFGYRPDNKRAMVIRGDVCGS